jgi:hypothetical protein
MKKNNEKLKNLSCRFNLSVRRVFGNFQIGSRLIILLFLFLHIQLKAQTVLSVNNNSIIQNNFLGINGVHNGTIYMNPQTMNGMTAANRTIVYDRLVKMGVHLVRTVYSPWYAARGNWNGTYDWNSTQMTQFYSWLQDMKDRNIEVALTLGYYYPADTYNWTSGITGDVTNNLNRIADWASQSIYQMVTVRGFTNVKYGILFTEPNTTPHNEVGGPPGGYDNWTYYKAVVTAIHNKLVSDGRRSLIKLVGPNNTTDGAYSAQAASELNNVIDIYSGHEYNKTDYTGWFNMATGIKNNIASTNKPFWIDEYGRQNNRDVPEYGNYIAQAASAFINAGAQTSLIWQISEDYFSSAAYPGSVDNGFYMNFGSDRYVPSNNTPYPSWYALSLMTRYMGGAGTQVFSTTNSNSVYISAIKQSNGDYSFLVVNGNSSQQSVSVNISASIGGKILYRYCYDPATVSPNSSATVIGYSSTFSNVTTGFTDNLPALGVVIYSTIKNNAAGGGSNGNLATGSTVTASSTDAGNGYSAAKAIDGDKGDFKGWSSAGVVPQWLLADFGVNKTYDKVVLNTTTGYLLKDYDIQYWDGTNYITAAQVRNNTVKAVTTTFTAVTSSRIRINCITGDQWGLARIDELEVYNSAAPPSAPVVTASSTDAANGYSTAKAIDGDKGDFKGWASAGGVPQWLMVDYGVNKTYDKVVLNTTTGYLLKDYDIQYWDGTNYMTAAQVRNNTVKEVTTTFTAVTSSRIRINCITGDQWGLARIDELEVYNSAAPPSAPVVTASSTDAANGYSTAKAIDGDKGDFKGWASAGGVPQWLMVDYGVNKTYDKVVLNTTTGYLLKDYDIQYWNGTNYITAAQIRNNTVKEVTTTFTAVTSSRIRINCITGDQWGLARIDELQVFNANSALRAVKNIVSAPENSPVKIIAKDGFYKWLNTGWVKYTDASSASTKGEEDIWHVSIAGGVFIYDGRFANKKLVEASSKNIDFNFYPNPSNGLVSLAYQLPPKSKFSILVYTMDGKLVKQLSFTSANTDNAKLVVDVSGLSKGAYTFKINTNNHSVTHKLIIEK